MIGSDTLLAGGASRQRQERIVKAFNEGYIVVGSDETNDAVCVMTADGNPAKYTVICTPGGFDRFFRESAEEFKKTRPDFSTLVKIGAKYGIQIEGPSAS
ncbi:MAG: hypothetical protein JO025_03980 [Verrucomicrobia bacterium]|nr:hypothetical protein [Verrucomicrobiota bacterium]